MRTTLIAIIDRVRQGFWFLPGVMLLLGIGIGVLMRWVDGVVDVGADRLTWLMTTETAARATLSALMAALVTAATVVFSITMLTLSQNSSMYGSRLLRTFMNRSFTKITLGLFLGGSAYCMLTLHSIRGGGDFAFIPHLSVAVGILWGLASLFVLVFFLDYMSQSIQVQVVVRSVADDLFDALDVLYPEQAGESTDAADDEQRFLHDFEAQDTLHSEDIGYLSYIDVDRLLELSREHDCRLRLLCRPGDFFGWKLPLMECSGKLTDELEHELRQCFITSVRRTPRQDIEAAINELVELAVRALSPGVNNPFTAVACVDFLGEALARLTQRKFPATVRPDTEGTPRVLCDRTDYLGIVNAAFDQIRQYGRGSVAVTARLLEALQHAARFATANDRKQALQRQADMILRGAREQFTEQNDLEEIQQRYDRLQVLLAETSLER